MTGPNAAMRAFAVSAILAVALASARSARAQACCAGASAVTPGRLGLHDFVLVGVQARASALLGSLDASGAYRPHAAGSVEDDLEQDVFAGVRVLRRGQVALLVPIVETISRAGTLAGAGGGFGDVNLSARYDFLYAGQSRYIPGVAVLAGVTFPTGRPIDQAQEQLAVDTTGTGAFQFNGGIALEQSFGPWLIGLWGIVAARTSRPVDTAGGIISETLSPQLTALASLTYVTRSEIALAFAASFAYEGNPTINGVEQPGFERLIPTTTVGALFPLGDTWRFQPAISYVLPFAGINTPSTLGFSWTLVHSWF